MHIETQEGLGAWYLLLGDQVPQLRREGDLRQLKLPICKLQLHFFVFKDIGPAVLEVELHRELAVLVLHDWVDDPRELEESDSAILVGDGQVAEVRADLDGRDLFRNRVALLGRRSDSSGAP